MLAGNTTGSQNTANGTGALNANTTGNGNTATGQNTLSSNTIGFENTANGWHAMVHNTEGSTNTATGSRALESNTTGSFNEAYGYAALVLSTGDENIAIGESAGSNLTTGSNNIDIGNYNITTESSTDVAGESNTIRIGEPSTQAATFIAGISGATVPSGAAVVVGSDGHVGTIVSSARFKDAIKPMDKASEAILALKPVTFHYKKELDPNAIPQFGLVAEEVEKVNPDLVVRNAGGEIYTVRYEAVNAMLLNEFLKEHSAFLKEQRKVEEQDATIARLKQDFHSKLAEQQKGMEAVIAHLKEQDSKIQKVTDQLELSKPAPQVVSSSQR